MITRRDVLKTGIGAAGAAGAAAALAAPAPTGAAELTPNNLAERVKRVRAGPLMNLEQAYRVMEEEQLDGLVLAEPINVFHLTGHWGSLAKMGYPAPAYALLSKDQRQAPGLVMAQFIYYYTYADGYFDFPLQTWLFSGWDRRLQDDGNAAARDGEPPANPAYIFEDKGEVDLREIEVHRRGTLHAALSEQKLSADARWALVNAVKGMGLDRGRIGVDHLVVNAIFETAGLDAVPVYADRALRRIRAIKSPREIELMTFSAQANAEAALAAARAARAGATYQELRAAFFSEAARRGNLGVFMQVDTIGAETGDGEFREGQAFQIDCVSHGFPLPWRLRPNGLSWRTCALDEARHRRHRARLGRDHGSATAGPALFGDPPHRDGSDQEGRLRPRCGVHPAQRGPDAHRRSRGAPTARSTSRRTWCWPKT